MRKRERLFHAGEVSRRKIFTLGLLGLVGCARLEGAPSTIEVDRQKELDLSVHAKVGQVLIVRTVAIPVTAYHWAVQPTIGIIEQIGASVYEGTGEPLLGGLGRTRFTFVARSSGDIDLRFFLFVGASYSGTSEDHFVLHVFVR